MNLKLNKRQYLTFLMAAMGLALFVYQIINIYKHVWIPLYKGKISFLEDFQLFYELGQRVFLSPDSLYTSTNGIGSYVISMDKTIFHMYSPVAAFIFSFYSLFTLFQAYILHSIFTILSVFVTTFLIISMLKEVNYYKENKADSTSVLLIILGLAPITFDLAAGNINSIVLLISTLYFFCLYKKCDMTAGFLLSLAFWLKLYPVILVICAYKSDYKRFLTGLSLGIFLPLIIVSNFIPLHEFNYYYLKILPEYAHQTYSNIINQSTSALLVRLTNNFKSYKSWQPILMKTSIRISAILISALIALSIIRFLLFGKKKSTLVLFATLLALIPITTPIGWGHTYVLLIPAIIISLLNTRNIIILSITSLAILILFIPCYTQIDFINSIPLIRFLFYNRYVLSALTIIFCAISSQLIKDNNKVSLK